jgi:hypothetical protein
MTSGGKTAVASVSMPEQQQQNVDENNSSLTTTTTTNDETLENETTTMTNIKEANPNNKNEKNEHVGEAELKQTEVFLFVFF